MRRLILPVIGLLAALGATFSVARTQPRRQPTEPPAPPPVSDFPNTVAAVGAGRCSQPVYKSLGGGWSFEQAGTATQPGGESRHAAMERTPGEWAR